MKNTKTLLALTLLASATGFGAGQAAPLPTNIAAMKGAVDNAALQVRWGGWGYRGWRGGGWGYRGWGYGGWGAAAAGAIVGGAIASSAYGGYPYYGAGYGSGYGYCPPGGGYGYAPAYYAAPRYHYGW